MGEPNNVDLGVVPISAVQDTWFVGELNNADLEAVPISAVSIHGLWESQTMQIKKWWILFRQCSMLGLWES